MRVLCFTLLFGLILSIENPSFAQTSSQKGATYMATLSAVLTKKMQDDDISTDLENLRNNKTFVRNLQKKLDKLTNSKNGNSKDRQIRKILEQAGKDIDKLL